MTVLPKPLGASRRLLTALASGALLLTSAPAVAAPQQHPAGPPPATAPAMDEELADTIERLLIQRFRRVLELTPEQDATVTPLMEDLTDRRREHMKRRREGLRTLAALSQDSAIEEPLLVDRLNAFYAEQEGFVKEEVRLMTAIRGELTPVQQARLLAFEERFREEIRRRMQDARRGGRPRPRGDGTGPEDPRR